MCETIEKEKRKRIKQMAKEFVDFEPIEIDYFLAYVKRYRLKVE